ncbi:YqaJ viral recombinase family protein [Polynucleobacter sp. MWH-CaK5]|uniref:YqaJ viral recombinase family nuclease n=1 Tax=Polynucleobacter sp. MWH-CaK5 TaxID=2689107 RepID=UPI001BFDEF2C|nr:YqaJ viral recombinase family protein [Polynucleobacter sp. MWH-CaK5]QWD88182.1 YqaJ viral recombinase family protein [Polynucleobacter sp. MWH-CaK5]
MLNNQDFALLRAKSLGGSDIGAILGFSRYRSAVDVWMEKTGRVNNDADSLPLRFGSFAEEFVASEYTRSTGFNLVNHPKALVHPKYDYMHGHIDRFISEKPTIYDESGSLIATRILECKTANPFTAHEWGDLGSDQVPMAYLTQCLWYMAITGIEQTDLAVLMGNTDFRIYEIHRDLELEEMIFARAKDFWEEHVLKDIAPPAQRESDLKLLFPQSKPTKTVEAKHGTCELLAKLKTIQTQVETYEQEINQIKLSIMAQMKDAEVLTHQGQVVATWKSPKPSMKIDTKKLAEDHPDIIAPYHVQVANSRRFVIKNQ